jgi:hypothetical protein
MAKKGVLSSFPYYVKSFPELYATKINPVTTPGAFV